MKKYLALLLAVLLVCSLGVTALAEEAMSKGGIEAALEESDRITEEFLAKLRSMGPEEPDEETCTKIRNEIYRAAGWTVGWDRPVDLHTLDVDPAVLQLALSDIKSVPPERRLKVLDARETVIWHTSWWNDIEGPCSPSYIIDTHNRQIVYQVRFSEQFPGWDPPRPPHIKAIHDGIAAALAKSGR